MNAVRADLDGTFQTDIRNFILSPRFGAAVLRAKPELAANSHELSSMLQVQFPEPPPVTVDLLESMGRQALLLGRKEIPLTLIVLDEVQQFIRQDPALTLNIQTIAERLAGRFDGKVLLVATRQQALSDVQNLPKLLDSFPVQIALGEADVDTVIRKTVLRKKTSAEKDIRAMLAGLQARSVVTCGEAVWPTPFKVTTKLCWTGRCSRPGAAFGSACCAKLIGQVSAARSVVSSERRSLTGPADGDRRSAWPDPR